MEIIYFGALIQITGQLDLQLLVLAVTLVKQVKEFMLSQLVLVQGLSANHLEPLQLVITLVTQVKGKIQ
jgi:hypothetical protein